MATETKHVPGLVPEVNEEHCVQIKNIYYSFSLSLFFYTNYSSIVTLPEDRTKHSIHLAIWPFEDEAKFKIFGNKSNRSKLHEQRD
jgi:hypothetical protein